MHLAKFVRLLVTLVVFTCGIAVSQARAAQVMLHGVESDLEDTIDVKISVAGSAVFWDGAGFFPVRVTVANATKDERTWKLDFRVQQTSYYYGRDGDNISLGSEFSITVPARSTKEVVFFVPGPGALEADSQATLLATASGPGTDSRQVSIVSGWRKEGLHIAVSPKMVADMNSRIGSGSSSRDEAKLVQVDPSRWPADWRVWSPFDCVVMTHNEYEQLDAARASALRDWVALGGRLYVEPNDPFGRVRASHTKLGLGVIDRTRLPNAAYDSDSSSGAEAAELGHQQVAAARRAPWVSFCQMFSDEEAAQWLPRGVPVWVAIFLVIFGVLVGPLNIYWFAKEGRRHRLFFTVPIFSLGASIVMVVVIVLSDGFGGRGARRSLVILLPGENKAAVQQTQLSRTGMLLGKTFSIEDDTAISKVNNGDKTSPSKGTVTRAAGKASGVWYQSRSVQMHTLWRITPTRARVDLLSSERGTAPVVQSSAPGTLKNFLYVDSLGAYWVADEVPPGRRVTLTSLGRASARPKIMEYFKQISNGNFYALSEGGDLAPISSLDSIRWVDDRVLITGKIENGRAAQ